MNNIAVNDKKNMLYNAVRYIQADPADIADDVDSLKRKLRAKYGSSASSDQLRDMAAARIISRYSNLCGFTGGATALTGVVPGLGQTLTFFGGSAADVVLMLKYQIDMTVSLAAIYGRDIYRQDVRDMCMIAAALGTINNTAKSKGTKAATKAFVKLVNDNLKGATLKTVKALFKKVGTSFTRKAFAKSIPFGVGVVVSGSANKLCCKYTGARVKAMLCV
jgi:hypothetical protein